MSRNSYAVVLLLCAVLFTRLLAPLPDDPLADIDSAGYDLLATNLLDGHGFTMNRESPYCPETLRTPVYPVFLATSYQLFGHDFQIVFILQALLDVITAAVIYRLTRALAKCRQQSTALLALGAYVVSLSQWHYTTLLLTESLLTTLLALSIWFYWLAIRSYRPRYLVLCGIFLVLAALCKPNYQWMLPLLPVSILLQTGSRRQRLRRALVAVLTITILIAPWLARNYRLYEQVYLSQTFDENIARVSAVATLAEVNDETPVIWSERWEALYLSIVHNTATAHHWNNPPTRSCIDQYMRRRQIAATALDIIRDHPVAFVSAHTNGVINGLVSQEQLYWYEQISGETHEQVLSYIGKPITELPGLLVLMGIVWMLALALAYAFAIIGMYVLWRQERIFLLIVCALLFIALIVPGPLAWVRFRVPVVPYVAILFAFGWMHLLKHIRKPARLLINQYTGKGH